MPTEHTWRIGHFEGDVTLTVHQSKILRSLVDFFDEATTRDMLLPLVENRSLISLRSLDWLVTNFSKKHNVLCVTKAGLPFNVHHGYKAALVVNKRRNFDPFRRRPARVCIHLSDRVVDTTVGQLMFMHWAHCNGVLDYAHRNIALIEADMNATTRAVRALKASCASGVRKRTELTHIPIGRCMVYPSAKQIVL